MSLDALRAYIPTQDAVVGKLPKPKLEISGVEGDSEARAEPRASVGTG